MNDLELLKLAAKAAGYEINFEDYNDPEDWFAHGYDPETGDVDKWWNPLRSDADAFKLALSVVGGVSRSRVFDRVDCTFWDGTEWVVVSEPIANDIAKAACRVIVRTAAEIGKRKIDQ